MGRTKRTDSTKRTGTNKPTAVKAPPETVETVAETVETVQKKYGDDVPVWISPVACPNCKSRKIASTPNGSRFATNMRIRYHQCKECGAYFKSKEYL